MFKRIKDNLVSRVSSTGQHLSGLRADLRSRLSHFRRHRSASEQHVLTDDFSRVLTAWGIDDAAAIPGIIIVLRLRILVFAAPVAVCLIAALLLQSPASCLTLAFVTLPCLVGIVTTAWRIFILKKRHFLPLTRWLFTGFGLFGERP